MMIIFAYIFIIGWFKPNKNVTHILLEKWQYLMSLIFRLYHATMMPRTNSLHGTRRTVFSAGVTVLMNGLLSAVDMCAVSTFCGRLRHRVLLYTCLEFVCLDICMPWHPVGLNAQWCQVWFGLITTRVTAVLV